MVMEAFKVVNVRQSELIDTGNKAIRNRSIRYRDGRWTTDKQ